MADRVILCGGVGASALPVPDRRPLRLTLGGDEPNVHFRTEDMRRAAWAAVPPQFCDLLDIAAYVFCADQAVSRGGLTDEHWGADWRRRLFFHIPVRCLDRWRDERIRAQLVRTLSF